MKKILETGRLILREFNLSDTKFIIELLNTEGWIKYIGDRNVKTDEDTIRYLENGPMKSYAANGFGLCMVALKNNSEPIGMCGLIKREELEDIDIGFAFLPANGNNAITDFIIQNKEHEKKRLYNKHRAFSCSNFCLKFHKI